LIGHSLHKPQFILASSWTHDSFVLFEHICRRWRTFLGPEPVVAAYLNLNSNRNNKAGK